MSQPPELPRTPAEVKAWVESLSTDQVMELAQSMVTGGLDRNVGLTGRSAFDEQEAPIELPDPPDEPLLLTVRVALDETEPEVWRRLTIPGDLHLGVVHDALQQAMGWTDSHLHHFSLGRPYESPHFLTAFDVEEGDEGVLETDVRLDQVLRSPGDRIAYEYDFGDGWTHTLTLEQVDPLRTAAHGGAETQPSSAAYPLVCLGGERACPPEDVGGIPGYEEVAEWVRGGEDPDVELSSGLTPEELRRWLPEGWHPDHFDLDETNAALARLAPRDTEGALRQLAPELTEVVGRLSTAARFTIDDWLTAPGWRRLDAFTQAEAVALTTPWRVVLDAVGDGVALTAAGYLPPRVVERIFTEARLAEEWIGKGNREDLTPPVHELREQARRFGLLRKAKGHLLPTAKARRLRDDPKALLELILTEIALDGDPFERVAGGLLLVSVVGGQPLDLARRSRRTSPAIDDVTEALSLAGWRAGNGDYIEPGDVVRGSWLFTDAVQLLLKHVDGDEEAVADLTGRVALAILRRMG